MEEQKSRPRIILTGVIATGNGGDGIRLGPGVDADLTGAFTAGNGGHGINAEGSAELEKPEELAHGNGSRDDHWHKKPVGIVSLSVISGILVSVAGILIHKFL